MNFTKKEAKRKGSGKRKRKKREKGEKEKKRQKKNPLNLKAKYFKLNTILVNFPQVEMTSIIILTFLFICL